MSKLSILKKLFRFGRPKREPRRSVSGSPELDREFLQAVTRQGSQPPKPPEQQ